MSCVIVAILLAVWVGRTRIIADGAGLRWRRFGGWKCVGWGEVQDYYDRLSGQGQAQRAETRVIRTTAGEMRFGCYWVGAQALRQAAEQRAIAAAQEWGLIGTRSCDPWPRRFSYDTFSNRWSPRLLLKLLLMFVVYGLVQPALSLTGWAALLGWRMTLTTAALYLLLILPLVAMLVKSLLDYRAVQKRMGERVTLNPDGLVFEDGTRRVDARWEEITGYGIVAGKYMVETGGGAFDFLGSIKKARLLRENIKLYAAQSADTQWKVLADAEALGGEVARWSGGQVGVGARMFHYRTRSVRAWLWYGVLLIVILCGTVAVTFFGSIYGSLLGLLPFALLPLMLAAALLKGWQTYRWGGIYLDDDGLTQRRPLRQTRLMWAQVRDFYLADSNVGIVEGRDGRRVRFSSAIVGREELMAEIARRAADCGRTVWEKRLPA